MNYIEEDSKTVNAAWLQSAYEGFQQAIVEGNCNLAEDIMKDVKDKGFDIKEWEKELQVNCVEKDFS